MTYLRSDDPRPPATGPIAIRVAILGGIALAMFSIVFFRLWYLQILSGDRYVQEANNNRTRTLRVQAPRGDIMDRDGNILVDNRIGLALKVKPNELPDTPRQRRQELRRLARVADLTVGRIEREIRRQTRALPQSPVRLKRDIPYATVYYLRENQERFPGVTVEREFVRRYPGAALGAHLFGNVGEVTAEQLEEPRYRGLVPGDQVGQTGVEYEYDRFLRGAAGATRIQVDALGRPKGNPSVTPADAGENLRLTIDSELQQRGEQAIASYGLPAAFVAMDIRSGQILGLGSYPSFDPAIFTRRITENTFRQLTAKRNNSPLANRAIQGLYPTGSVFKPVTAAAALEAKLISPGKTITDTGELKVGEVTFRNAADQVFGTINLRDALQVSSDIYFYRLGLQAEEKGGQLIQEMAFDLGFGEKTGIDLPAETEGLVPTPEYRNRLFQARETDRPWTVGDNINFSVGQGDLQAHPLNVAVAYAALANGGEVVRPHIGMQVEDAASRVLEQVEPAPKTVQIRERYRKAILEGLNRAAHQPGGTSYKTFGAFPVQIAGKTGTAERPGHEDQAWYAAVAPYDNPRVVVVVTIEEGGFGADTAAPTTRSILAQYFNVKPEEIRDVETGEESTE